MPFTASLSDDRFRNPMAGCAGLAEHRLWHQQPLEIRKRYCLPCPFRFLKQPSCSLDFLTVGETTALKGQLSDCINMFLHANHPWSHFNGSVHEVELAYHYLGLATPRPRAVLERFLSSCLDVQRDAAFWKEWNYHFVEGCDARPVRADTGPTKGVVGKIVDNLTEPSTYKGKRLYHLFAASAVLEDAAGQGRLEVAQAAFGALLESCRRALMANAALEVS